MLLSTKTSNQIASFPHAVKLFAGNGMVKNCGVTVKNRFEAADYQLIKSSCSFRNIKKERVKEMKWIFV